MLKLARPDAGLGLADFSNLVEGEIIPKGAVEVGSFCLIKGLSTYAKSFADPALRPAPAKLLAAGYRFFDTFSPKVFFRSTL